MLKIKFSIPSEQIVSKIIDAEAIVIDLQTGIYFSMEGTAAKIWRELNGGVDLQDLIAEAQNMYPDSKQVSAQIEVFVATLVSDGLLAEAKNVGSDTSVIEEVEWPKTFSPPERVSFDDVAAMVALDPPLPELQSYSSDR